jgi:hypothetical protein
MISPYLKRPLRTLAQARAERHAERHAELGDAPGKEQKWVPAPANAGSDLFASTARISAIRVIKPSIARKPDEHPKAA